MKREQCGGCGGPDLKTVLDLGSSPLADTFVTDREESAAAQRYPLTMVQCQQCFLAQIGDVIPDELLWTEDFGYYSSTSPSLLKHFSAYADWAIRGTSMLRGPLVVEVGCNDGILLRHFDEAGYRTLGIEPATGPASVAAGLGLEIVTEGLTLALADKLTRQHGLASLVLANNVAAHVSDLPDFLAGLRALLRPDGYLVLEVQDYEALMLGHGFDMLYHEHRFFYDRASLGLALRRAGLDIISTSKVATQGGSLRVVAQQVPIPWRGAYQNGSPTPAQIGLGAQRRADAIRLNLVRMLGEMAGPRTTIAAYGAPAKATTLLHWTGAHNFIDFAADTTPAKIGRFLPGTCIEILDAATCPTPDVYLVTAWNYLPDIIRREGAFLANGGRFIVPLPVPVVI